jgi:hypothetical protein
MATKNHILVPPPGSCDDDAVVRGLITDSIKRSAKSREEIAELMSQFTGQKITLRMLNAYTAEAAERHRFPLSFARAFCVAVGDWLLLNFIAERAGFRVIDARDTQVLEVGRSYLAQRKIASRMTELERQLAENGEKGEAL